MHCHDLKKGNKFVCEECGFEIEIINECKCEKGECEHDPEKCVFKCCDKELVKKE